MVRSPSTFAKSRLLAATRWAGRIALLALLAAVIGAIAVLMVVPRMTQGSALTVLTGSMTPEIPVGSVVLVRPVDPATLEPGDVATYQREPGVDSYITHRVVELVPRTNPQQFIFKGDANRGTDAEPIPAGAIRGEVWFHVPYLGAIRDGLYGKGGITAALMILLGAYAVSQLVGGVRDHKSKQAPLELTRPIVLARLDRERLQTGLGLDVEQAAHRWQAALVDQDKTSATLLLAPQQDSLVAVVELLVGLDPLGIEVWQGDAKITGTGPSGRVAELLGARPSARSTGSRSAQV